MSGFGWLLVSGFAWWEVVWVLAVVDLVWSLASTSTSTSTSTSSFAGVAGAERPVLESRLADIRAVRSWLDGLEAAVAGRLDGEPTVFVEQVLATAAGSSLREGVRKARRSRTLRSVPELAARMSEGTVSGAHADVVARAAARLEPAQRTMFLARGAWLASQAAGVSIDVFARVVAKEVQRLEALADGGVRRLKRQRRSTFLRHWVDKDSGMVCVRGEFDPERGLVLTSRIDQATEAMFHGVLPEDCPTGDAKQDHLRALALLHLTRRPRRTSGSDDRAGGTVPTSGSTQTPTDSDSDNGAPANSASPPGPGRVFAAGQAATTGTGQADQTSGTGGTAVTGEAAPTTGRADTSGTSDAARTRETSTGSGRTRDVARTGQVGDVGRCEDGAFRRPPDPGDQMGGPGSEADGFDTGWSEMAARAEIIVVVDQETLLSGTTHPGTILDCGHPEIQLPIETIRRFCCLGTIVPVLMNADGVVTGLGRTTRLANRNQRRALRAMYPTCAIAGCHVPVSKCQPHHVSWWRNGGTTDLHNLVPLCSRHHHLAHEGGWTLQLHPHTRQLTITMPDSTTMSTGPPRSRTGRSG